MNKQQIFPYRHAFVLGLAKSGTAAIRVLLKEKVPVRLLDDSLQPTDDIVKELNQQGVQVVFHAKDPYILDGIDVVVKNPGIRYDHPVVQLAQSLHIPIVTEVELADHLAHDNEIIGVTGSNGKTTTTSLIHHMLKESDLRVRLAGNIGVVACEEAATLKHDETLLLELSSFQLLGTPSLRPHIAILLNLYEAHIDYHRTFENYIEAKTNIFKNQTKKDYLIYNADQPLVVEQVKNSRATLIPFSVTKKLTNGAWCDDEYVYFRNEKITAIDEIALVGTHNMENILAAICASMLTGANKASIAQVLRTFTGVDHRLQFIKNIKGRSFYNDSKATNILATKKALQSFHKPTILLAGGLDRGNEFDELIPALTNVKALVLFGETKEKIARAGKKAKIDKIYFVNDVREAAKKAFEISKRGDVILLSPACASWDQYKTFEQRGEIFVQTVHILA